MSIIAELETRLIGKGRTVIFTEFQDQRILEASRYLKDKDICQPVLLGPIEQIKESATEFGISLSGMTLYPSDNEQEKEQTAQRYSEQNPAFSAKRVLKKLSHPLNYAAILVSLGEVDCLAAGVVHSTGEVILAAQQYIGMKDGISTLSSIGYQTINLEGIRYIGLSDCAVQSNPTAEELADTAVVTAVSYANTFQKVPKVAFLSYSTDGSSEGESVDKVQEALRLAKEKAPDILFDGEFQLDSALIPAVAQTKVKRASEVAGDADVLIFPNLDAGNMVVKAMQLFGKLPSYGPILQGFNRPVTDFSRSAKTEDVVGNIVIALNQAGNLS